MSFSYKFKTLRIGTSYDSSAKLERSAREGEVTGEVETDATEGNLESSVRFSSDLVNERIKASLEILHAQIAALIEMMDRLIQSNSARETATESTRETRCLDESAFTGTPLAPLTTSGYSPDNIPSQYGTSTFSGIECKDK